MVSGLVWGWVSPVREYFLLCGFLLLVTVSWVAVSILSEEICDTELSDGFTNHELLIHNKLFQSILPAVSQVWIWLPGFCHIMRVWWDTWLVLRKPCLKWFPQTIPALLGWQVKILHICSWMAPMGIGQSSGNGWWQGWEWLMAALGMAGHPAHPQGCGERSDKMWAGHYFKPVRRHLGNLRWINLRCKV